VLLSPTSTPPPAARHLHAACGGRRGGRLALPARPLPARSAVGRAPAPGPGAARRTRRALRRGGAAHPRLPALPPCGRRGDHRGPGAYAGRILYLKVLTGDRAEELAGVHRQLTPGVPVPRVIGVAPAQGILAIEALAGLTLRAAVTSGAPLPPRASSWTCPAASRPRGWSPGATRGPSPTRAGTCAAPAAGARAGGRDRPCRCGVDRARPVPSSRCTATCTTRRCC
jgi:hypothetical protein